ncbi:Uncharacterised protein at_DN2291 [Pycnogonum litorale]
MPYLTLPQVVRFAKKFKDKLSVSGMEENIQLSAMNMTKSVKSEVIRLKVKSEHGEPLEMSRVFVIDDIPIRNVKVDTKRFNHLKELNLNLYRSGNVEADILIGQDNAEALLPLEVRKGKRGDPFAVRTIIGWSLNGAHSMPNHHQLRNKAISHFVSKVTINDEISKLWEMENEGLEECQTAWSQEDKSVIDLWDRKCRKVNGHYEIPIPWKDKSEKLPNNFNLAKGRLDNLVKRLRRDKMYDK